MAADSGFGELKQFRPLPSIPGDREAPAPASPLVIDEQPVASVDAGTILLGIAADQLRFPPNLV